MKKQKKKKKMSKKKIIIILIAILLVICVGFGGYFYYQYRELKKPISKDWGQRYYLYLKDINENGMEEDAALPVDVKDADLIILNTCAVRAKATDKVYSALGRIRRAKKESALEADSVTLFVRTCLQLHNIACLQLAVLTRGHFEGNSLTLVERFEAFALDRRKMYENIVAVFAGDKAVTLLGVEPFNSSLVHVDTSTVW